MTTKNQTAIRAAESESDSFDALQERFMSLTSRLEVLGQALGQVLINNENEPVGLS